VVVDDQRENFMMEQSTTTGPSHKINRNNIFDDVVDLFDSSLTLKEYPVKISFLNEKGYDTGGLLRDMLSEFWKTAYIRMFDGSGQLIPSIYPQTNMSLFTSLGKILSHGYMISRVMPLQITFPTFASVLLGPGVKVDDDMLITCLANSVSASESQLIRDSLKVNSGEFDNDTCDKLVNLLSRYDARVIPTPSRFKTELI